MIVGDESAASWAARVGVSQPTVSRILRGKSGVSADVLQAMSRVESVRSDWLLEGKGSPYLTIRCFDTHEAREELEMRLKDEPNAWSVTVCGNDQCLRVVIVLSQPGRIQQIRPDAVNRSIDYTIQETLVSPGVDAAMVDLMKQLAARVRYIALGSGDLMDLGMGRVGGSGLSEWIHVRAEDAERAGVVFSAVVDPELGVRIQRLPVRDQRILSTLVDAMEQEQPQAYLRAAEPPPDDYQRGNDED